MSPLATPPLASPLRHRSLLRPLAALCLAVLAGAPRPLGAEDLRIGFAGRVTSLDPHFFVGPANTSAAMHVFDRLLHRAPDGALQPWLASSWHAVTDTAWEFQLQPDARWHDGAKVTAELFGKTIDFTLGQSGFHWGMNSLCVLLMLDALDVPLDTGLSALADFQPLAGRGQTRTVAAPGGGFTLIDESYNANPLSMAAGFRSLGAKPVPAGGRRIVVLTDMLELGDQSSSLHEGLAVTIAAAGLDLVHTAGPEMKRLHDVLPPARRGLWRETAAELAAEAADLVASGDVVMVKGSNGSKASLVAKALSDLGSPSSSDAPRAER